MFGIIMDSSSVALKTNACVGQVGKGGVGSEDEEINFSTQMISVLLV